MKKFKIKNEKFSDFISKLEDITKIKDVFKLKIDKDNILMYSIAGETTILALKSFLIKTDEYFDFEDFDYTMDFVVNNAKKVIKNINFLKENPTIEFSHKDSPDDPSVKYVRSATFKDKKLTVSVIGGEQYKIKDLNKKLLSQRLDPKNSKWSFVLKLEDYLDIKKLSTINEEKVLNINVEKGVVTFSELGKWKLVVDELEGKDAEIIFNKKYLSSIEQTEEIIFNMFDSFILVKGIDSNLMLSFEQSFDDDED